MYPKYELNSTAYITKEYGQIIFQLLAGLLFINVINKIQKLSTFFRASSDEQIDTPSNGLWH